MLAYRQSTFIEKSTSKTDLEPENVSRLRQDALFSVKIISQTVFPDPTEIEDLRCKWVVALQNTINHFYIDTITVSADIILFLLYYLHSFRYQSCCYMSGIIFTFIVKHKVYVFESFYLGNIHLE